MADHSVIEQLKQGVPAWNTWKAKQPTAPLLDLSGTDFTSITIHLDGIDLTFCNLRGCNLSGCQAAEALFAFADLQGANLSRTNLRSAYFAGADLSNAILAGAILKGAYMVAADLTEANLSGADLSEADFINTTLNRAILTGADLSRTDFLQASLQGTDFSSCLLGGLTVFGDVDLSEARGLDRIKPMDGGPVVLDIRSIYWSHGRIPEQFLRAARLPESFLALIPTLHFEEEDGDAQSNETEPTEEDRKSQAP